MVIPIEERIKSIYTLESRLAEKFDDLQLAREQRAVEGMGSMFDELIKSIEVLMKGKPDAYQELLLYKQELERTYIEERNTVYVEAANYRDEVSQHIFLDRKINEARWEFRELYEEIIMDIMQKYQLIDMKHPSQIAIVPSQTQPEQQYQQYQEPQESETQQVFQQQQIPQQQIQQQQIPQQQIIEEPKKNGIFNRINQMKSQKQRTEI